MSKTALCAKLMEHMLQLRDEIFYKDLFTFRGINHADYSFTQSSAFRHTSVTETGKKGNVPGNTPVSTMINAGVIP